MRATVGVKSGRGLFYTPTSMKPQEILAITSDAMAKLVCLGYCSINATLAKQFRDALVKLNIPVNVGLYDDCHNIQWFYLN